MSGSSFPARQWRAPLGSKSRAGPRISTRSKKTWRLPDTPASASLPHAPRYLGLALMPGGEGWQFEPKWSTRRRAARKTAASSDSDSPSAAEAVTDMRTAASPMPQCWSGGGSGNRSPTSITPTHIGRATPNQPLSGDGAWRVQGDPGFAADDLAAATAAAVEQRWQCGRRRFRAITVVTARRAAARAAHTRRQCHPAHNAEQRRRHGERRRAQR